MNKTLGILVMLFGSLVPATAQRMLNLDSCRALALRNNKQLQVSNVKQDVAANLRHSARTKYLPHVSAVGSYVHTTREVSVLSDGIKGMLPNLGTSIASGLGNEMGNMIGSLPPQTLATLGQLGLSPEASHS